MRPGPQSALQKSFKVADFERFLSHGLNNVGHFFILISLITAMTVKGLLDQAGGNFYLDILLLSW